MKNQVSEFYTDAIAPILFTVKNGVNIYPADMINQEGLYRWGFCYLTGDAEAVYQQDTPDMFLADIPMPDKPCQFHVNIAGHTALVTIINDDGQLTGLVALLSDSDALMHVARTTDQSTLNILTHGQRQTCQNGLDIRAML